MKDQENKIEEAIEFLDELLDHVDFIDFKSKKEVFDKAKEFKVSIPRSLEGMTLMNGDTTGILLDDEIIYPSLPKARWRIGKMTCREYVVRDCKTGTTKFSYKVCKILPA